MAIVVENSWVNQSTTDNGSTWSWSLPATFTAGRLLVLAGTLTDARSATTAITDDGTGSWTVIEYSSVGNSTHAAGFIAYKIAAGDETTITGNSAYDPRVTLLECSGHAASPFDDSAQDVNQTATVSPSATASGAGASFVSVGTGIYAYTTDSFSGFSGYSPTGTSINNVSHANDCCFKTHASAGTINPTGTLTDGQVSAYMALFLEAASAGVTVTVPQANLSLSTFAPDVSVPVTAIEIDVGQANLTLSTTAPTVDRTANRDVTVAQANLALSTAAPDVETTANVAIDGVAGNLTLSTTAPTVERTDNRDITVAQANISLSSVRPDVLVTAAGAIVVDAANLTISAEAPTVEQTANRNITVGAANLALSTTAPIASRNIGISPAAGSLLLSTLAPELTVAANQAITVDAAALALSTAAPTVEQTTNSVRLPGAASLSLSGFAPTIEQTGRDIWTDVSAASTSWTEITGASTTWTEI